jgi:hypothetical protein
MLCLMLDLKNARLALNKAKSAFEKLFKGTENLTLVLMISLEAKIEL